MKNIRYQVYQLSAVDLKTVNTYTRSELQTTSMKESV